MVFMRIHCNACGGTWEVYRRQRDTSAARACPHCDYTIDPDTWKGKVLPAFQAVGAANMALASDHVEKHTADFQIDYIADGRFHNAEGTELKESVCAIAQAMHDMCALVINSKV